jgi:hypothetical protein
MTEPKQLFMIAEYCAGPFYMGWWLYLRESKERQKRNADGEWGWVRYSPSECNLDRTTGTSLHPCRQVFEALGIEGDLRGGCGDESAIARFAFAHRIPRQRIGGKPRGCVPVQRDEWGTITLRQESVAR